MTQQLALVSLLVADYDEAIAFYTQKLGFQLTEDSPQGNKRWVVVTPSGGGCALLLAKAVGPDQIACIGQQMGGRVGFFLHTTQFWPDYQRMVEQGVQFLEQPRTEPYATVVVFADLYGNKWDLLQRNTNKEQSLSS